MIDAENTGPGPIDAVITWVDGNTDAHRTKRARYMADSVGTLHENATNPHRWQNNDEILFCLQSIENFAPWTRKIWIVVDTEPPDLSVLSAELRAKVGIVFHEDIFGEFSAFLPTFNSLAIESLIWRINGLSDRFMYFNDDVFLSAPLHPSDVFKDFSPVLRGQWVDYRALLDRPKVRKDPAKFNHFMQINAAGLVGVDAGRLFSSAHVVHPLVRPVMAKLFDQHRDAFIENIKHRFRDLSQFLPQGLHNHACIAANRAIVQTREDHLHVKSGQGVGRPADETWALLQNANAPEIKFLCVNDLTQLEMVVPEARDWLCRVIGGFPSLVR